MKQLEEEWREEASINFADHRAKLIQQVRLAKTEAWEMFIKSCKNYKEPSTTENFSMQKVEVFDEDEEYVGPSISKGSTSAPEGIFGYETELSHANTEHFSD